MDNLKNLFACLVMYKHNLQILHWNSTGIDFSSAHEETDEYIDKFEKMIDEVGEIIKSLGGNPIGLKDCIEILEKDTTEIYFGADASHDYNYEEVLESIDKMFEDLIKLYTKCHEDSSIDIFNKSKLHKHGYYCMVEGSYKTKAKRK
ncbi:MAG: ferritin-like domain-containing protein [Herbinix sp.]|nr:ferritin-like domain-containing protein [Herbinix sp.]